MRRVVACVRLSGSVLAVLNAACAETQIERHPIQVQLLQHADTLTVGHSESVQVGAMVGYDDCSLENEALERRGDSLIVRGNARCERTRRSSLSASRVQIATPPARPNYEMLSFSLANLEPATYVVVGGDLADSLVIVASGSTARTTRLAVLGSIGELDNLCPGAVSFVADWSGGWLKYELIGMAMPAEPLHGVLHADLLGPTLCDSLLGFGGRLRVRDLAPVPRPKPAAER